MVYSAIADSLFLMVDDKPLKSFFLLITGNNSQRDYKADSGVLLGVQIIQWQ